MHWSGCSTHSLMLHAHCVWKLYYIDISLSFENKKKLILPLAMKTTLSVINTRVLSFDERAFCLCTELSFQNMRQTSFPSRHLPHAFVQSSFLSLNPDLAIAKLIQQQLSWLHVSGPHHQCWQQRQLPAAGVCCRFLLPWYVWANCKQLLLLLSTVLIQIPPVWWFVLYCYKQINSPISIPLVFPCWAALGSFSFCVRGKRHCTQQTGTHLITKRDTLSGGCKEAAGVKRIARPTNFMAVTPLCENTLFVNWKNAHLRLGSEPHSALCSSLLSPLSSLHLPAHCLAC